MLNSVISVIMCGVVGGLAVFMAYEIQDAIKEIK